MLFLFLSLALLWGCTSLTPNEPQGEPAGTSSQPILDDGEPALPEQSLENHPQESELPVAQPGPVIVTPEPVQAPTDEELLAGLGVNVQDDFEQSLEDLEVLRKLES